MSEQHVLPIKTYLAVFGGLLVMTAVTTGVAYLDMGLFNTPVALLIAAFKVLIVVLYFMHVRYSSRLVMVMAATGFFWLLILFVLTMQDYASRTPVQGWIG